MSKLFIEVYSYHAETLYPYVDSQSDSDDTLLYNPDINEAASVHRIQINKDEYSLLSLLKVLWKKNVESIHINTVSINLYAKSLGVWKKNISVLLIPYIGKLLFNCKIYGIVHEADQFYPASKNVGAKHKYFQCLYGWIHIKLFNGVYVLAPEVKNYLDQFAKNIRLLSTASLQKLAAPVPVSNGGRNLVWIGAIDSGRRNWKILTEIKPSVLERHNTCINFLCDINQNEGPEFLSAMESRGLKPYMKIRFYRPDDAELFAAVRDSCMVLCLFSNDCYGQVKTSGARHIAMAFNKSIIAWDGAYKIINTKGETIHSSDNINEILDNISIFKDSENLK